MTLIFAVFLFLEVKFIVPKFLNIISKKSYKNEYPGLNRDSAEANRLIDNRLVLLFHNRVKSFFLSKTEKNICIYIYIYSSKITT